MATKKLNKSKKSVSKSSKQTKKKVLETNHHTEMASVWHFPFFDFFVYEAM